MHARTTERFLRLAIVPQTVAQTSATTMKIAGLIANAASAGAHVTSAPD